MGIQVYEAITAKHCGSMTTGCVELQSKKDECCDSSQNENGNAIFVSVTLYGTTSFHMQKWNGLFMHHLRMNTCSTPHIYTVLQMAILWVV